MSTIQKPKFRKTCSAMAAKILDRKSAKLPAQAWFNAPLEMMNLHLSLHR